MGVEERGHQFLNWKACFCRPLMSVSAKLRTYPRRMHPDSLIGLIAQLVGWIINLALILSMTAPVPPAHLSFIDGFSSFGHDLHLV